MLDLIFCAWAGLCLGLLFWVMLVLIEREIEGRLAEREYRIPAWWE